MHSFLTMLLLRLVMAIIDASPNRRMTLKHFYETILRLTERTHAEVSGCEIVICLDVCRLAEYQGIVLRSLRPEFSCAEEMFVAMDVEHPRFDAALVKAMKKFLTVPPPSLFETLKFAFVWCFLALVWQCGVTHEYEEIPSNTEYFSERFSVAYNYFPL